MYLKKIFLPCFLMPSLLSALPIGPNSSIRGVVPDNSSAVRMNVDLPNEREAEQLISSQIYRVDDLIAVSERNLATQKQLRDLLAHYKQVRDQALRTPQDNEALYRQSLIAKRVMDLIENCHLEYLFSREFLNELNIFSRVATRRAVPR